VVSGAPGVAGPSGGRILAARIVAWFFAAVAAVPMFGLVDLGTVFGLANPQWEWPVSLEASWGSLFTFFVAGGFGWIGAVPVRPWPGLALVALATMALATAGALFLDPGPVWVAAGLAVSTAAVHLLLWPGRPPGELGWPATRPWPLLAVAGVPLWLGYAWHTWTAALLGRDPGDVTNGVDHWPVQVALGLALAAGSALLAQWRTDLRLWRWAFALTAIVVAYATLAFPDRAGAMPHPAWGVGFAVWGGLLLLPWRQP